MAKKMDEIKSLNKDELSRRRLDLKKELIKLNAQVATGTIPKNPSTIKNTRKAIARINMLIHDKETEEKLKKQEGSRS